MLAKIIDHKTGLGSTPSWIRFCLLVAFASTASAQTLARPGWVGSGLNTDPWWKHAVFYQIAGQTNPVDFKSLTVRLDALQSLGVDALLLQAPVLPAPGSNGSMPDLDSFDDLLRQASGHGIRVLITLDPPNSSTDLAGLVRFWLNHGIAGLHISTPQGASPEGMQALVQTVRKLVAGAPGQRIVISDLDLAQPQTAQSSHRAAATRPTRSSSDQLQIDARLNRLQTLDAATLRPILVQTITQPSLLLDLRPPSSSPASADAHSPLANAIATVALLTHPSVLIDSSANLVLEPTIPRAEEPEQVAKPATPPPPPPQPGVYLPYVPYIPPVKPRTPPPPKTTAPDPLTTWYLQLAALHHSNAAVKSGTKIFLDFDAQNALVWVFRPATPTLANPPVFVLCNLSASPMQLSLAEGLKSLNLHGLFLRTLLRSDSGLGAQNINTVTLPPYAVYIGELKR